MGVGVGAGPGPDPGFGVGFDVGAPVVAFIGEELPAPQPVIQNIKIATVRIARPMSERDRGLEATKEEFMALTGSVTYSDEARLPRAALLG